MKELNDTNEFICQNCGSVLNVRMIDNKRSFSKKELTEMLNAEDFSDMLISDMSLIDVYCDCGKPKLSVNDSIMLSEVNYWKYSDNEMLGVPDTSGVPVPKYLDSKSSLSKVVSDAGNIHTAWELDNKMVLVFEFIGSNYPQVAMYVSDSIDDYFESISGIEWIVNGLNDDVLYQYYLYESKGKQKAPTVA